MSNREKLVRPRKGRVLAGVCNGLAQYFGISESLVRIGFALAFVFGSLGFWAYLLCWVIIPEEKLQRF